MREAWQGSTSLIQSWRAVDWLLNRHTSSRASRPPLLPVLQTTLNNLPNRDSHTPNQLAAFWTQRILGYQPADLIAVMADFMAQPSQPGNPPWPLDFPIGTADTDGIDSDTWPHYWHSRLRTMVGLILASPYAMLR